MLGGGAIGLELSQAMARFGVQVTVIEGSDRLLAMEEPESSAVAAAALAADGVKALTGVRASAVRHEHGRFATTLSDGGTLTSEGLLVATGRAARLAGLGIQHVGLDPSARFIPTDDRMKAAENVWAIGDVTGNGNFTHMAFYEADIAVRDILGQGGPGADYRARPRVTFIDPEIGAVGATEKQARDAGVDIQVGHLPLTSTSRGFIHGPGNDGLHQVDRGPGTRSADRRHDRRPGRRRDDRRAVGGRARRGAGADIAEHDLGVPHLPPRHRGCAQGSELDRSFVGLAGAGRGIARSCSGSVSPSYSPGSSRPDRWTR